MVNYGEPGKQNIEVIPESLGQKFHRHPSSFGERGQVEASTAHLAVPTGYQDALFLSYIYYPCFSEAHSCYRGL